MNDRNPRQDANGIDLVVGARVSLNASIEKLSGIDTRGPNCRLLLDVPPGIMPARVSTNTAALFTRAAMGTADAADPADELIARLTEDKRQLAQRINELETAATRTQNADATAAADLARARETLRTEQAKTQRALDAGEKQRRIVQELQAEVDRLQLLVDSADTESESQKKIAELQTALAESQQNFLAEQKKLADDLAAAEKDIDETEAALDAANAEIDSLRNQLAGKTDVKADVKTDAEVKADVEPKAEPPAPPVAPPKPKRPSL